MFDLSSYHIHSHDGKNDSEMKLLEQLHEQYAINNNANLSSIVTLVTAMIVAIGYFFYVYIHSTLLFSGDFGQFYKDGVYYLDSLLIIFVGTFFVIEALSCLCIYQGIAQRKEQFITHAIRTKVFGKDYLENSDVFPKKYNPFYKKETEAIQGLYGELYKLFKFTRWLLFLFIIAKLIAHVCYFYPHGELDTEGFIVISLCSLATLVIVGFGCCYKQKQYDSYCTREEEYQHIITKKTKKEKRTTFFICKMLMTFFND